MWRKKLLSFCLGLFVIGSPTVSIFLLSYNLPTASTSFWLCKSSTKFQFSGLEITGLHIFDALIDKTDENETEQERARRRMLKQVSTSDENEAANGNDDTLIPVAVKVFT